jgi:hypothetical protein
MSEPSRYAAALDADAALDNPERGNMVPTPRTLDGFAHEPGCNDGVALQSFEAGTVLNVITRHSRYRLVVVDPVQKRVLVTGGRLFPENTEVRFEGATAGGSLVKVGWIGVGLRFEMSLGRQRITTSRVESITVESVPPLRSSRLIF